MSRLAAMINPWSAENKARRADQKRRAEEFGWWGAKSPVEQAEMAQANYERMAPETGPPTADAERYKNVAQTTAEGVLREGSQGGTMDLGGLAKGFDPSNAESVRQMQRMLNQAGFTGADGQPLAEDGMFGRKTEAALRRMQGGHRTDHASVADLTENPNARGNVNTRGKEHLASREGRGDSVVPQQAPVQAAPFGPAFVQQAPDYDINTKQREDAVGSVRSGAKGIDDYIESKAPWLGDSSAYRGAKEGVKKFFNWAGDADY